MRGIILSGGHGSRLYPLTKIFNKSLLPIYDKPMIYYPLQTLKQIGITEICIVSGKEHCGQIMNQLGSGEEYGVDITYRVQEKPGGIAQALSLCESFAGDEPITVCLGDNIFEDDFGNNSWQIFTTEWIDEFFDEEPNSCDIPWKEGGVNFVVDQKSAMLLEGTVINWTETMMWRGFDFDNPNVSQKCGCGLSFSIRGKNQ